MNADLLERVSQNIGQVDADSVNFIRAFADETRLKILMTLTEVSKLEAKVEQVRAAALAAGTEPFSKIEPLNVSELAALVEGEQSAVSHQLRVLFQGRMISRSAKGREMHYRIRDGRIPKVLEVLLAPE
jgi:DNA-binding transcriptional ArsR family regulator